MKLADYKDSNGTSVQSYAELLTGKCEETGLSYVLVFLDKKPETRGIHVLSNIDAAALPTAMIRLGQEMKDEPIGATKIERIVEPS